MPELTVIAFDPGETTGYCIMTVPKVKFLTCAKYNLEIELATQTGQIDCRDENRGVSVMLDVWAGLEEFSLCPVIHEDFIVDMNKIDQARHTLSPVRVTAKFEFGAYQQGFDTGRLFIQNRSPVKTTCTDDRLKNWGLYDKHSGPHARDATRHAFYFLRNCRGDSLKAREMRWRAWPHIFEDPQIRHTKPTPKVGERVPGLG